MPSAGDSVYTCGMRKMACAKAELAAKKACSSVACMAHAPVVPPLHAIWSAERLGAGHKDTCSCHRPVQHALQLTAVPAAPTHMAAPAAHAGCCYVGPPQHAETQRTGSKPRADQLAGRVRPQPSLARNLAAFERQVLGRITSGHDHPRSCSHCQPTWTNKPWSQAKL